MKITVLFTLLTAIFFVSCSKGGPSEEDLFKDTKEFIEKTSNKTIEIIKIDVNNKSYETNLGNEVLNYDFTGTISFNTDCYLDWNNNKPVFVPEFEKPIAFNSLNYKFHKKGDVIKYKGHTTYIKKKDVWEVLSM